MALVKITGACAQKPQPVRQVAVATLRNRGVIAMVLPHPRQNATATSEVALTALLVVDDGIPITHEGSNVHFGPAS